MKRFFPFHRSPNDEEPDRPVTSCRWVTRVPVRALALGLFLSRSALAAVVMVPARFAGTEGDVSEVSLLGQENNRVQIAFSAALLGLSGLKSGDHIVGLTFRLDADEPVDLAEQTVEQYTITLGTPTHLPGSMDLTFANNLDASAVVVRSGPLVVRSGDFEATDSPRRLGVPIVFQQEYVYQGGALLLDISHALFPQGGRSVDAVSTLSATDAQILFGTPGSSTADLGSVLGASPVLGLAVIAVPEPQFLPIALGLGCAGWALARRLRS